MKSQLFINNKSSKSIQKYVDDLIKTVSLQSYRYVES